MEVTKKPVQVKDITLHLSTTKLIDFLELYNNAGTIIAGPTSTVSGANESTAKFTDPISLGIGRHRFTLKGRLDGQFTDGESFQIWTTPSTDWHAGSGTRFRSPVSCKPNQPVISPPIVARRAQLIVSSNPASYWDIAVGGSNDNVVSVIDLRASYDAIALQQLSFKLAPTASHHDIIKGSIWDGATKVGESYFLWWAPETATIVLTSPIIIPENGSKTLAVKCDFASIGIADPGRTGHIVKIDYDDEHPENSFGVGLTTGNQTFISGTTDSPGVLLVRSFPFIAQLPLPSTGLADGRLMAFSMEAHYMNLVGLGKISFACVGSGVSDISVTLYAYTDPAFTQPVAGFSPDGALAPAQVITPTLGANNLAEFFPQANGVLQTLEIPAGTKYYFLLRGAFTSTANAWLSTFLPTEEVGGIVDTFDAIEQLPLSFMIWSPNSYGLTEYSESDWLNSFHLPYLGSEGFIQTRFR